MIELTGLTVSRGRALGKCRLLSSLESFSKSNEMGVMIAAKNLTPDLVLVMDGALGIVTEIGGMTCHAATIARELNIPCVTQLSGLMELLKPGVIIEITGEEGKVLIGDNT